MTPREYHLKRKFGITEKKYDQLLRRQNGCCPLCQRPHTEFANRLSVDHNHKTGEIRGLLCFRDNKFTIGRQTDPAVFDRAAMYLRQGTGWFVPVKVKKKKKPKKRKRRTKYPKG